MAPLKSFSQQCLCDLPNTIKIGAPGVTTTLNQAISQGLLPMPNAALTPQNVCIKGTLEITSSYTFTSSFINLDADASIIATGYNVKLSIMNSTMYGCTNMYNGIIVGPSSKLELSASTVRDGKEAVLALEGSTLTITDNTFQNNHIGVRLYGLFWFTSFNLPVPITGNTFETLGTMLPPYNNEQGFAGIRAESCNSFTVGTTNQAASPNVFQHLQNGIVATNSKFAVHGASFFDMNPGGLISPNLALPPKGYGIFVESNSKILLTNSNFQLLNTGLHGTNSSMEVYGNNFQDSPDEGIGITAGIRAFNSASKPSINIHDNTLDVLRWGMVFVDCGAASNFEVINNTIDVGDTGLDPVFSGRSGIELTNCNFPSNKPGLIEDNTINTHAAVSGINLNPCSYVNTNSNNIHIYPESGTAVNIGINSNLSHHLNFYGNNIIAASVQSTGARGIQAVRTTDSKYCCNTINGNSIGSSTFMGTIFEGVCLGTKFRGTIFGNATVGLLYMPDALTGESTGGQDNANNKWTGTYSDVAARHTGNFQSVNMSKYRVSPFAPPTLPPSIDASGTWFGPFPGPSGFECSYSTTCISDIETWPPDTARIIIAGGDWNSGLDYQPTLNWEAETQLYKDIMLQPDWKSSYPVMQSFFNAKQGTSVQQFFDIDKGKDILNAGPSSEGNLMANNDEAIFNKLHEITNKDNQLYVSIGGNAETLANERAVLVSDLVSLVADNNSLVVALDNDRYDKVSSMSSKNSNVTATQVFELNQKRLNAVWLATWASGIVTFTQNQMNELVDIANQCPKSGGGAVILARAMLQTVMDSNYNDDGLCNTERSATPSQSAEASNFEVFPNPADNSITITLPTSSVSALNLQISDISGRIVNKAEIDSKTNVYSLEVQSLPNGIYFLRLMNGSAIYGTKKIIISH